MESPSDADGLNAGDIIPNSYIIILKDDTSDLTFKDHQEWVCDCHAKSLRSQGLEAPETPFQYIYDFGTMKGYCGTFDQATVDEISARPDVAYVEPNQIVGIDSDHDHNHENPPLAPASNDPDPAVYHAGATETETTAAFAYVEPEEIPGAKEAVSLSSASVGSGRAFSTGPKHTVIQSPIHSWGLAGISHRSGAGNRYVHHSTGGFGVVVFVLDTGIRITHNDFSGRARWGHNFIHGSPNTDIHGHGTHVAGTIAGRLHGVAKRANVVAVKVLGGRATGTLSVILAGVQWAVRNAPPGGRSIINMSIVANTSQAFNQSVDSAVRAGVTVVVSAGDDGGDANRRSPASAALAITVASTLSNLHRAVNSNRGTAVTIFAPGIDIVSCGIRNDSDWRSDSGTSMAAPHLAGVTAFLIGLENLRGPPAIRTRLLSLASRGIVRSLGQDSPNLFLHNGSNMQ